MGWVSYAKRAGTCRTEAPTNAPTKQPPLSTECVPAFHNAQEDRMMKKESHIIRTRATNSEGRIVGVTIDTCAQHCGSTLNCVAFMYTSGSRGCVLLSNTKSKKAKDVYKGWSHFEM